MPFSVWIDMIENVPRSRSWNVPFPSPFVAKSLTEMSHTFNTKLGILCICIGYMATTSPVCFFRGISGLQYGTGYCPLIWEHHWGGGLLNGCSCQSSQWLLKSTHWLPSGLWFRPLWTMYPNCSFFLLKFLVYIFTKVKPDQNNLKKQPPHPVCSHQTI